MGPRRVRRARLDRGLAASRGSIHPRRLGQTRAREGLRSAQLRGAGSTARAAHAAFASEHLRPEHAHPDDRRRAGTRLPLEFGALRGRVQRGPGRVFDSAERSARSREAARSRRVLLLDVVGCRHGASGRRGHLHQQLAARAARRQHRHRRRAGMDRGQHPLAAGGHRRHGALACRAGARAATNTSTSGAPFRSGCSAVSSSGYSWCPARSGPSSGAPTSSARSWRCSCYPRPPSRASTALRSGTDATPTLQSPSTGAGGWCICGSKGSSRCSRPC